MLLTERASTLRSHAGQVSFPGGGTDPGDRGAVATALREAEEETGLVPAGVVPLAVLPDLFIPPSGFVVTPVLAHWADPTAVHAVDPSETAAVVRVPLAALADPPTGSRCAIRPATSEPAFIVAGLLVWGFTGGLLSALLHLGGWERPWDTDQGPRPGRGVGRSRRGGRGSCTETALGHELGRSPRRRSSRCSRPISGWRHGMAVALLSFVGVLGGAIIGVRLAPLLAAGISNTNTRVIVSIVVVVMLVALGETTGVFLGRRIRDRITGERFLAVDSALGSVLQALAVVVAAWLVALPLATASLPGIASGVRGSQVLRAVDSVMPTAANQLPAELRQLLDNSGFPDVLSPFARTPITATGPPNSALAQQPGRRGRAAAAS